MIKADLHNHLGRNGKNPGFDETIDLVHKKMGDNSAFGICNCTSVDYRYEDFTNQKGKYERVWLDYEKRILFVPEKKIYIVGAEEVITSQGHLVVSGMPSNKKIQKSDKTLSLEDALKSANEFNGIKIAVHPFGWSGAGNYISNNRRLLYSFDGWEIYNASAELSIPGFLPSGANGKSEIFYNFDIKSQFDIGACAFTDGHSVNVVGKSYTNLYLETVSLDSLRKAIKKNKSSYNLHMESNKKDAFVHACKMFAHKYLYTGD